jgi:hypothetical protein
MESLTQMQSIIYFILTGIAIITLTILSPIYGTSSIMIDLGLVAIYGKCFYNVYLWMIFIFIFL